MSETTIDATGKWKRIDTNNPLFNTIRLFLVNPTGLVSLGIILVYAFLAIAGPAIAPYNPLALNLSGRLLPPSYAHIMGTDEYGRDIWSRILYAIRLDMAIAFLAVSIGYTTGVLLGMISGYFGKFTDHAIMRVMDILLSFPSILFAIAIAIAIGQGFWTVIIAVSVVSIPGFARVTRSTVLSTKNELYILAAVRDVGD